MSVNQRDFVLRSGAEGDAGRCIRDSSQTCSLPRLLNGQRCSLQTKSYAYKAQEDKLNPYRRSEASKLKLPPIRDTAKLRELSANNIKELKNQNYVLQQQLKDSKTENKLLKNVLHRHTVALQQYQELDGSISQIQDQHRNEVKTLRKLLAETRSSRDKLARKLQSTERELLDCKDRISHLQWRVNRNPNLLEKEELTRRLSEFIIQLEEKDRRIQFLEKSNMLLQGSLNRHVATEYKNMSKTNEMSLGLQSTVSELSKKTQLDRTREAETNSINTIRSRKHGRKAKQSKMVQTEKLSSTNSEADSRIKSDLSGTDERVQRWQRPASSDYVPHKSRPTEQRRKNSQRHSDKKSACGDAQYRQEERRDSSEDTQESDESDEEEDEEKEKSRDEDDKGEEEEQEEEENEDREGQGRPEGHNGEGKEEKEEHDDEDYEDDGMDQNVEEETEETEGKEQRSEETRLEETFEDTTGEHEEGEEWDYDDEEQEEEEENKENDENVYVEVQLEEKNKENEKKKNEEDDDEWKKMKKKKEDDDEGKKKKKKKDDEDDDEGKEEEERAEEEEKENAAEEAEENIEVEAKPGEEFEEREAVKQRKAQEMREALDERAGGEVEEDDGAVVIVEDVKQQEKRKEKGDQKDIRTYTRCSLSCLLNDTKGVTPREPKRCSRPKNRRKYNFTPVTKNLHLGKPAYSGVQLRYHKGANVPVKEETLYCRNRRRSAEMIEDVYLSDEQTSQPDAASDSSDLDSKHNDSPSWT
ncbi:uncharacterized protein DDB_G0286299-like [Hippocampus zosterae]|uniref:uncharacterized protein DDB_G0286299-like n=1 Tax=Hippocampus zosterae TaxID=109293 RepID=UPI00223D6C8D|nr:uncharacterized protein DDB_G0286299-like [Hippocampus zosterae]XP_051934398.1 uncharacterized protein DDB_G0286299-like [Hippocampus zosterae]XP_051934399.1 uncharacterized protein DDB_G0286299-like [Hippocampus zosterae]